MTLPTADAVMMPTNVDTPALTKLSVSVVPVTLMPPTVVANFELSESYHSATPDWPLKYLLPAGVLI